MRARYGLFDIRRLAGRVFRRTDPMLCISLFFICVGGLFLLYSATGGNFDVVRRQGVLLVLGFVALLLTTRLPLEHFKTGALAGMAIGFFLLVLTHLVGVELNGSQRWLPLFSGVVLQTSELIKVILPMMLAAYLCDSQLSDEGPGVGKTLIALLLIVVMVALVALQPDLGTAAIVFVSGGTVLLLAGLKRGWFVGMGALGLVSPWLIWSVMEDYQKQRVLTFFSPESDPLGSGWNINQSLIAIGSGGVQGKGYLRGTQSNLDFVPESHTDFIFSVLAEEGGLISCLVLMGLFAVVVWRTLVLIGSFRRQSHKVFAASFVIVFTAQGIINIAMACGLLPVVGLPLPLISQGGSGKVVVLFGFGLVMAMAYHGKLYKSKGGLWT